MSRNTKIVLVIVAALLLVCLCGVVGAVLYFVPVGRSVTSAIERPQGEAPAVAAEVAEVEVPAGFTEAYTTEFAGFSLVGYDSSDGRSHITLFQAPAVLPFDEAQLRAQLENATDGWIDADYANLDVVGSEEVVIRGEPVTLTVTEGAGSDGEPYRVVSGVFAGEGGTTLLTIAGPIATWDQTAVDNFISSIP